jgi:hypothetical protein
MALEQEIADKLFDKMNSIAIALATLTAKVEAKESRCEDHQRTSNDHELRIRVLETDAASGAGENKNSHDWRSSLISVFTMAAAIIGTILAMIIAIKAGHV